MKRFLVFILVGAFLQINGKEQDTDIKAKKQ